MTKQDDITASWDQQPHEGNDMAWTETCERCGFVFKKITTQHRRFCDKVPPPVVVAQEYLASEYTFTKWASRTYDVGKTQLRSRVDEGLKALGHDPQKVHKARRKGTQEGLRNGKPLVKRKRQDLDASAFCSGCTMLLLAEDREAGECEFCSGKNFDYMEAVVSAEYGMGDTPFTAVLNRG